MTRYLEIKPGSIAETAIRLRDDYQAYFKKELEKTGKGIAQMTDAEKKAFFNRIDKEFNAKNEAMDSSWIKKEIDKEKKTTLVAAPGNKEKVIRIPKEKLADYKAKGYVEAESFVPEQANNPYAIGMAAAMKATGDTPPLKKSTIVKAHKIADKVKNEEIKEEIKVDKPAIIKSLQDRLKKLESDPDHGGKQDMIAYVKSKLKMLQSTKDEELTAGQKKLPPALQKAIKAKEKNEEIKLEDKDSGGIDALRAIKGKRLRLQGELERLNKDDPSYREKAANLRGQIEKQKEIMASKQREVYGSFDPSIEDALDLYEGGFKDIDIRKGDLKLAKDKKQALKDKYNAIMANQAQGDENSIADQIQKLDASIKKQEQELIDIMKKSKENQKNEAVDPERVQKLNQKIASMTTKVGELDKSKPENKTKEAILKSDIATAKLRLQDLMQKGASDVKKAVNEASKAKQSYKTLKMSLKKKQEINNKKKTLTDKPITKIEVNPKIEN
jgi:hypothetical protein